MIVLDASLLIAHLAVDDAHQDAAFEILDTEDDLLVHPLTLAEALVFPAKVGTEQADRARIESLGVELRDEDPDEPVRIARLRASTALKLPDCCVLATAARSDATLATFDRRLADAARERGIDVVGA